MRRLRAVWLLALTLSLLPRETSGAGTRQLIPSEISATVRLGMTAADLRAARPRVRAVIADERRELLIKFLLGGALWEGASYRIENDRLVAVSLTRGGIRPEGTREAIREAVRLAIEQFGGDFEKGVALSPGDPGFFLCPILVWKAPEQNVFLSFGTTTWRNGSEHNRLRLTLAAKDKAVGDLFRLPEKEAEKRFLDSDFDRVLEEALGTHVGSDPGGVAESTEERGLPATSAADPPRAASRPEAQERRLRRRSALAYVAVGAAAAIAAAGAWLFLRRRSGG